MSTVFGILKQEYINGEKSRISYGIAAFDSICDGDTASVIHSVGDVSEDYQKVSELVDLCNREQLSLMHLDSVIEDFLNT